MEKILSKVLSSKGFKLGDFIKLGLQLCNILSPLHMAGLTHGNICEMNIQVDEKENYQLLNSQNAGTVTYMAPELYQGNTYDKSADIYALGMLLYKMLNNQRLPFLPDAPAPFSNAEAENAEQKRIAGETPPIPYHANRRLSEIVLKALGSKENRYVTVDELKNDLSAYGASLSADEFKIVLIKPAITGEPSPVPTPVNTVPVNTDIKQGSKMPNAVIAIIAAIAVCLFAGAVFAIFYFTRTFGDTDKPVIAAIEATPSPTPAVIDTNETNPAPEETPAPITQVSTVNRVVAAGKHTVALREDGMLLVTGFAGTEIYSPEGMVGHFLDLRDVVKITGLSRDIAMINTDGHVLTSFKFNDLDRFRNIIDVAIGGNHLVGLKADGTVIASGSDWYGELDVGNWTDITAVFAGRDWTVGLMSNGRVVATGKNENSQCDVSEWRNIISIFVGDDYTLGITTDGNVVGKGSRWWYEPINFDDFKDIVQLAGGSGHLVGLRSDGTVMARGNNFRGQCNVNGWTDIIKIAAAHDMTIGLKADGTIVSTGGHQWIYVDTATLYNGVVDILLTSNFLAVLFENGWISATGQGYYEDLREFPLWLMFNDISNLTTVVTGDNFIAVLNEEGKVFVCGDVFSGQYLATEWEAVTSIAAGYDFIVGITKDGRVLHTDIMGYNEIDTSSWSDIIAVSAGFGFVIGLKSDGTMVGSGDNYNGQLNVRNFTDIVAISAGFGHTVALKADGTLEAIGDNFDGQCDVQNWSDVVKIDASEYITVGLKSDGTVLIAGYTAWGEINVSSWTNIVDIAAGFDHVVGLRADGTFVATGGNDVGQIDVSLWKIK